MTKDELVHKIYTRVPGVARVILFKSETAIYFELQNGKMFKADLDGFVEESTDHFAFLRSNDLTKSIQKLLNHRV